MKKRGILTQTIIKFVLGLLIIVFVGYWISKIFGLGMDFTEPIISDIKAGSCQLDTENAIDDDNDKIPDECDICLGGNNDEDSDNDKIAKACDKDDNDATVKKCKFIAEYEDNKYCCAEEEEYRISETETVECKKPGFFG